MWPSFFSIVSVASFSIWKVSDFKFSNSLSGTIGSASSAMDLSSFASSGKFWTLRTESCYSERIPRMSEPAG